MRKLLWLVEGHLRETWRHTSLIVVTLANCHRGKGPPVKFSDVYPFDKQDGLTREKWEALKDATIRATRGVQS